MGKNGYKKIEACCAESAKDGFEYAWIDTCCIDKTNSVKLQEAINSMFVWYQNSKICYAYLLDCFTIGDCQTDLDQALQGSKWFTRGWTLQELIAPRTVMFYDCNWHRLGSRADSSLLSRESLVSALKCWTVKVFSGAVLPRECRGPQKERRLGPKMPPSAL